MGVKRRGGNGKEKYKQVWKGVGGFVWEEHVEQFAFRTVFYILFNEMHIIQQHA
jgi:hypothetical protein